MHTAYQGMLHSAASLPSLELNSYFLIYKQGFLSGKESACNAGDTMGLILGSGRSPGGGNSTPLQYSCLENPMDRGAWWAAVHGIAKSQTRLSDSLSLSPSGTAEKTN